MEKYYKVSEGELIGLLVSWLELNALERAGVDNWHGYEEAINEEFDDIAVTYLEDYQEVE